MHYKRITRVVIAVKDAAATAAFYSETYGLKTEVRAEQPGGGLKRVWVDVGNAFIELLEPLREDLPEARFIREKGEGLYMLCMEVDDAKAAVKDLRERGARIDEAPDGGDFKAYILPESTHGVLIGLSE